MLNRRVVTFVILVGLCGSAANAGEVRELQLKDGTVVVGTVQAFGNGKYTVESESLGTLTLSDADIVSMKSRNAESDASRGAPTPAASQSSSAREDGSAQVDTLQRKILSDADLMNEIQALQNDPEFQRILQDPEVVEAIKSGNIAALQFNARIQNLATHPKVQAIMGRIGQ